MSKFKKAKRIGFFPGGDDDENDNDLTPRKPAKFTDPRITAFCASYTCVVNPAEADEFILLSKVRTMFNAFPFKDKDPLRELLYELEENDFRLHVDELDRMGYPVRRNQSFLELPTKQQDNHECD